MLIEAAERRILPDALIRRGIRKLLGDRLRQERLRASSDERPQRLNDLFAAGPIAEATDAARRQHYEAPTELFEHMLGPRLKYSACLWAPGVTTLAAAEEAMLAATCARARIADGHRILDLGCGWGSLSLWLAEHYPAAEIVAVSNSRTQHAFIERRAAEQGFTNLRHYVGNVGDWADPAAMPWARLGVFDRVVSIEMFEHMRNVQLLLQRIAAILRDDGRLFVHIFCHRDLAYRFVDAGKADWMARHFFTGGAMPPAELFAHLAGPFELLERTDVSGRHYARTCRAWLENLDAHREAFLSRFRRDLPPAAARQQWQRWRMFVMACEELFAYAGGEEWFVTHQLLAKQGCG